MFWQTLIKIHFNSNLFLKQSEPYFADKINLRERGEVSQNYEETQLCWKVDIIGYMVK
jgi:hypothetical protein